MNNYLESLEINDNSNLVNNKNLTHLERDINLNSNPIQNIEIANPQRHFIVNENKNNNLLNDKISEYSFIQKKNYTQNLNINFKK